MSDSESLSTVGGCETCECGAMTYLVLNVDILIPQFSKARGP